uniref:PPM-type phosphatase domain-containing protein n=1 Tax=Brassica campestris TaxID=3711 RepID=M4D4P4_BRACM
MADPLMVLSLQPHPFLIFSSSLNRRWGLSRSGIRFSVSEFRLRTSQLQLSNSTSPSQSSSSSTAPEKLDLVSSTQLKDGSHVFRFGDATEVERYLESEEKARCFELEKKQRGKIAEEGVKDGHALVDLDPVSELESPKEKSAVKRKTVKSSTETVSEKEEKAVHASLSSVIKIKDRKRVRSPVKKKKETSSTVDVLGSGDEVEAKVANSIVSVAEAIPTSSTEEKTNENVEPLSSEVMEKVSVNEIRDCETNGYNQLTESRVEEQAGPGSSSSEHDSQLNDLKEVIKVSTVELDENLEEMENLMKTFEAEENLVVEPTATVALSPDELVDVSPEENLVVEPTATVAVSTDELVVVSPEEDLVVEPTATVAVSTDELVVVSPEEDLVVEPTATVAVSTDELVVVSPEEDLVVEPTATVAVSTDELVVVSPEEDLVVEPTATVAVSPDELVVTSPDELISTSEATNHSVEEIAETPVIDTSEVANDEENVASTIEGEVVVIDSKNDNGSISKTVNDTNDEDLQLPEPETAGLQPIEVASDREELVSKSFYLESGSASLQNPNKALAGREDAYFISDNNNWLGVADGVSQWSFEGISEGMYAQELMSNCEKIISDETAEICDDPVHVLHRSVNETKSSGSSTALIAHLSNNELHIANIGDSGFMVVRNRTVLQKSSPMFHHFCFPLHITRGDDILKLAEVYHVNLEEGDVVITASDGLFDNLYEKEIVSIVCRLLEQGLEPQRIAELVAAKAQEVGRSETERTPFGDAAKEEGHDGYRGGKLDAVTVIVSLVKTVSI